MSLIAVFVVGCAAYHLTAFATLHLLVPSIDPASGIITDYVNSPYSGLARSTFVAFGLMWSGVAAGLWRTLPRRPLAVAGVALMAVGAASLVVVTFVPAMADPRSAVDGGRLLVRSGGIGRAALFLSVVLLSVSVQRDSRWAMAGRSMTALAGTAVLLLVITLAVLLERGYGGIAQRIIFAVLYAWVFVAAYAVIGQRA